MKYMRCPTPVLFFFNDTATTEIYTLSLNDALPISEDPYMAGAQAVIAEGLPGISGPLGQVIQCSDADRDLVAATLGEHLGENWKTTLLNSRPPIISYTLLLFSK